MMMATTAVGEKERVTVSEGAQMQRNSWSKYTHTEIRLRKRKNLKTSTRILQVAL
jgi:hypothetical protein